MRTIFTLVVIFPVLCFGEKAPFKDLVTLNSPKRYFEERCYNLMQGLTFTVKGSSKFKINLNVHHHNKDGSLDLPVKIKGVYEFDELFNVKSGQAGEHYHYCVQLSNAEGTESSWDIEFTISQNE